VAASTLMHSTFDSLVTVMSTLKKNKRIKRAKQYAIYGDNKPAAGRSLCQKGKPKYLGGNGRKTTGITIRKFRLNLQSVRVLEDGKIVRRNVPVKHIRSGLIVKPIVRAPFTIDK
jgi:large subunit ribosomal protein L28